jgi:hypothetical protein
MYDRGIRVRSIPQQLLPAFVQVYCALTDSSERAMKQSFRMALIAAGAHEAALADECKPCAELPQLSRWLCELRRKRFTSLVSPAMSNLTLQQLAAPFDLACALCSVHESISSRYQPTLVGSLVHRIAVVSSNAFWMEAPLKMEMRFV